MFNDSSFKLHQSNEFQYLNISGDSSSPPLVLLHGMFGGLSNFDPLLERLNSVTAYVPAIPLFEMERSKLTIPALAQWVDYFLDDCSIQKPVLLGNSMGGHIAQEYARIFPEKVSGLVLTGSSGLLENDFGTTTPRRYDRDYIRKQASRTFYEDIIDEETVDEICEVVQTPSKLAKVLAVARNTHTYTMEEHLEALALPVLLIWGRDDIITPPEVARMFHQKLPNSRLEWISRCGHAPMMERPDEFVKPLINFISELEIQPKPITDTYEENYTHIRSSTGDRSL